MCVRAQCSLSVAAQATQTKPLSNTQELARANALLCGVRGSLKALSAACAGLAPLSTELDCVGRALYDGKVPVAWLRFGFACVKPLGGYILELLQRIAFFKAWLTDGPPPVFWLSAFFFTQAFLTGIRQNYARRRRMPIDRVEFDFLVMDALSLPPKPDQLISGSCSSSGAVQRPPADGAYVDGLYLEGADWDADAHELAECAPRSLHARLPVLWLLPGEAASFRPRPHYSCPLYKTPERHGVLSTTGHSTNFVLDVRLPSSLPGEHWVKRGTALLAALSE